MTETESARTVFDANVIVSALLFPRSIPGQALGLARRSGVLLTSRELLEELRTVLSRPKSDRYVAPELRDEFLVALVAEAELIEITERIDVCRDPKDNKVLDAAVNGSATCIVSGDNDLLTLHPFRSISILSPADFIEQYGKATP